MGVISWSEASLEAGELQLIDGSLVGEGGSGDPTGRTSFFTQPHLPVDNRGSVQLSMLLFYNISFMVKLQDTVWNKQAKTNENKKSLSRDRAGKETV